MVDSVGLLSALLRFVVDSCGSSCRKRKLQIKPITSIALRQLLPMILLQTVHCVFTPLFNLNTFIAKIKCSTLIHTYKVNLFNIETDAAEVE